jgi:hypothetical protein
VDQVAMRFALVTAAVALVAGIVLTVWAWWGSSDRCVPRVYDRIRKLAEAAVVASDGEIARRALDLKEELDERFADVADLGSRLGTCIKQIKDAHALAPKPKAVTPPKPSTGTLTVTENNPAIYRDPIEPEALESTNEKLRKAVREFWEFWSDRHARIAQLKRARRQLGGR